MTRILADTIVLLHLAFIVFVALGGFAALRWPRVAWAHLPAALWGAMLEFCGWICPLTPLEKALRTAGGGSAYEGGFIDRYVMPLIYPTGLTRGMQVSLGVSVIAINLLAYGLVIRRWRRKSLSKG
jgi:hypothetical protein